MGFFGKKKAADEAAAADVGSADIGADAAAGRVTSGGGAVSTSSDKNPFVSTRKRPYPLTLDTHWPSTLATSFPCRLGRLPIALARPHWLHSRAAAEAVLLNA